MWVKTERERDVFNIDESYVKTNEDGTKERMRFVQYPKTPKGMVNCFHTKIRKTNVTFGEFFGKDYAGSEEYLWETMFNTSKEISLEDVEYYFGFDISSNSKVNKITKTIKDIFNGFKI